MENRWHRIRQARELGMNTDGAFMHRTLPQFGCFFRERGKRHGARIKLKPKSDGNNWRGATAAYFFRRCT